MSENNIQEVLVETLVILRNNLNYDNTGSFSTEPINYILAKGEIGLHYEGSAKKDGFDISKVVAKAGTGVHTWDQLPVINDASEYVEAYVNDVIGLETVEGSFVKVNTTQRKFKISAVEGSSATYAYLYGENLFNPRYTDNFTEDFYEYVNTKDGSKHKISLGSYTKKITWTEDDGSTKEGKITINRDGSVTLSGYILNSGALTNITLSRDFSVYLPSGNGDYEYRFELLDEHRTVHPNMYFHLGGTGGSLLFNGTRKGFIDAAAGYFTIEASATDNITGGNLEGNILIQIRNNSTTGPLYFEDPVTLYPKICRQYKVNNLSEDIICPFNVKSIAGFSSNNQPAAIKVSYINNGIDAVSSENPIGLVTYKDKMSWDSIPSTITSVKSDLESKINSTKSSLQSTINDAKSSLQSNINTVNAKILKNLVEGSATGSIKQIGSTATGKHSSAFGNQSIASGSGAHSEGSFYSTSGSAAVTIHNKNIKYYDSNNSEYNISDDLIKAFIDANGNHCYIENKTSIKFSITAPTVDAEKTYTVTLDVTGDQNSIDAANILISGTGLTQQSAEMVAKNGSNASYLINSTLSYPSDGNLNSRTIEISIKNTTGSNLIINSITVAGPAFIVVEASGSNSHAEGEATTAIGNRGHAEGFRAIASGDASHAEGFITAALKSHSHAEGMDTVANGTDSHVEGCRSITRGCSSHAEGFRTNSNGIATHTQGIDTRAGVSLDEWLNYIMQDCGNPENIFKTVNINIIITKYTFNVLEYLIGCFYSMSTNDIDNFDAWLDLSTYKSNTTYRIGINLIVSTVYTNIKISTLAMGSENADVKNKLKELFNIARASAASAAGIGTIASQEAQFVSGTYNAEDPSAINIVGNGTSDSDRSNAHTLSRNGDAWYAGEVFTGGSSINDPVAKKLATHEHVEEQLARKQNNIIISATPPTNAAPGTMWLDISGSTLAYAEGVGF